MKREDIKAGDVIVLNNGNEFRIVSMMGSMHIMRLGTYFVKDPLSDICDSNLKSIGNCSQIDSIYRDGKLIWTKPIEMTIAEIEKALGITSGSLRIKD